MVTKKTGVLAEMLRLFFFYQKMEGDIVFMKFVVDEMPCNGFDCLLSRYTGHCYNCTISNRQCPLEYGKKCLYLVEEKRKETEYETNII